MDKTGVGLPLFQDLQDASASRIKGYNFSEKILVDFDELPRRHPEGGDDDVKEAGITKNVLGYTSPILDYSVRPMDSGRVF